MGGISLGTDKYPEESEATEGILHLRTKEISHRIIGVEQADNPALPVFKTGLPECGV
jgi:hypothetical protein